MKRTIALLIVLLPIAGRCQERPASAVSILERTLSKLESVKMISYHETRDTRYFADNYSNHFEADLYFDFTAEGAAGLRFQADQQKSFFLYDGTKTIRLDKENLTIDTASATTKKSIQDNSYLYHSIAMLRRMLPLAIANDSLQKSASDTLVNGKAFYNVLLEGPGIYFSLFGDIVHFTAAGLKRPYYLLIDKNTFLPYQFISKYIREADDRDFVTVTYTALNTNPAQPESNSWNYLSYLSTYKPYVAPVKIPLVKPGTLLADFTLPVYLPSGPSRLSLSEFKGKVVLVDFWFKSCGPCMEAMPHYNELQNAFGKKDFALLTVNVEDPEADIKFFYNKHSPVYPMLYNGGALWRSLGFTGCPSSVLIDRSGKVVDAIFGFNREQISKKIAALL